MRAAAAAEDEEEEEEGSEARAQTMTTGFTLLLPLVSISPQCFQKIPTDVRVGTRHVLFVVL